MTRWRGRPAHVVAAGLLSVVVGGALVALGLTWVHVTTAVVLTATALLGLALQAGHVDQPWEPARPEEIASSREEVAHLSWQIRRRSGHVHPRVLARVQEIASARLSRAGIPVTPSDMAGRDDAVVQRLARALDPGAAQTLCADPHRLPDGPALLRVLDALDELAARSPAAPPTHRKDPL